MAVFVKYGPQNEAQKQHQENVANYEARGTNKSYYDSLFMGTPYESQYQAILRKYSSNQPPESLWGLLTGQNSLNEYNHNMSLMDELESLATKVYDEEYQSPLSDVARQRAAGLNPDLNGLSSQSAALRQSGGIPSVGSANPLEVMSNTLSTIMSIYSTIKGFKGINLQNEKMDLDNIQEMMKMARPMITENLAHGLVKGSEGMSDWSDVIALYNPFKGDKRKSQRFARAFNLELSSGNYAAAEAAYKRLAGIEDSRSAYGTHVGNPNWSADDNALFHYVGGMAEMSLGAQFSKNRYDRNLYRQLSPDAKAMFENSENRSKAFLNRVRNKMLRQLDHDFENGSTLAGLLIMGQNPNFMHGISHNLENIGGKFAGKNVRF